MARQSPIRKLSTKTNEILKLIQHIKLSDTRLYEAIKLLIAQDNMTWLISHTGTLVDGDFTPVGIVNETVRIIRMYCAARVAPTTDNCIIKVWRSYDLGDITYGPLLVIPKNSKISQIVTGKSNPPLVDLEFEDRYYTQVIQAGGAVDVTTALECEVDLQGR